MYCNKNINKVKTPQNNFLLKMCTLLGKPQKNLNCSAIKQGGGLRTCPYFFLVPFKNKKKYFSLDNLSTFGHSTLKFPVGILTSLIHYLPKKNPALFAQKIICKNPFQAILRQKKSYCH